MQSKLNSRVDRLEASAMPERPTIVLLGCDEDELEARCTQARAENPGKVVQSILLTGPDGRRYCT